MIRGKYIYYGNELDSIFEIRKEVFPEEAETDEYDDAAIYALAYFEDKAVAVGRLIYNGQRYEIGKIAVLKEYRGKYYGDFIVRMLIDKAFQNGIEEVYVYTPMSFTAFYSKIGFYQTNADSNQQDHVLMCITKSSLCKQCDK